MSRSVLVVDPVSRASASPELWGIFLEDLNYAVDGGLNAELVVNGDFEFTQADVPGWGPLTGWGVVNASPGRTVWPRTAHPVHANNATHIRIDGPTVLRNDGWDGVGVTAGAAFRLAFAARLVSGIGDEAVAARIVQDQRTLVAESTFSVADEEWTWFSADLIGVEAGRGFLELKVADGTVVDLDCVSLRPLGEDGAPQIFRGDLVEVLRGLRPSFVRFPGGCLAHGVGLDNIYDWKGSIGPRHERLQMPNPWGYHQSRAIGYFEYFLLCEELGATPLPVIAAGVCCQNTPGGPRAIDLEDMPAYIKDVHDLIEFANGDAETPWGAVRAQLGHPEPFALRYIGVGNEDEITPDFRDRYARIEDAVRHAHPDIDVIGTSGPFSSGRDFELGWSFARERGTALVDEHYYDAPMWFHQNIGRYDAYDRSGPKVYLGEFAARSNKVRSALAEAAYMVGLERNSDIVRLVSYAPLLARVGHTQWQPDLIYFDSERILPSASYFVQQMFASERGDAIHDVHGDVGGEIPVAALSEGALAARTSDAEFAVHGIELNGVRLEDRAVGVGERVIVGDGRMDDLELTLVAERRSGERGLALELGRGDGPEFAYRIDLGTWRNGTSVVKRQQFGIDGDISELLAWRGFTTGVPVVVRVRVSQGRLRIWADDVLLQDIRPADRAEARVAVGALSRDGHDGVREYVLRLVNASDEATAFAVRIGEGDVESAHSMVLAGASPDAGEAFAPSPVAPAAGTASVRDGVVDVDLPPWSLTILVVRLRRAEDPS